MVWMRSICICSYCCSFQSLSLKYPRILCISFSNKNKKYKYKLCLFLLYHAINLNRPENVWQLIILKFIDFPYSWAFFWFQIVCTYWMIFRCSWVLKQNIPYPVCSNALQLTSVPFNLYWGTHPPHNCFWNLEKKFHLLFFFLPLTEMVHTVNIHAQNCKYWHVD